MIRFVGWAILASALVAGSAAALEKTSARMIDRGDDWSASSTGSIRYYNNCTGWVWVWSGWSPSESVGVNFAGACNLEFLNVSWALTFSGVPSGYGFTGTIQVTDGGCGPVLGAQPYLPPVTSGWNATVWNGLPIADRFAVNIVWSAPTGFTNSTGLASDHPFAGPTGPTACGTCFPTTRVSRSRYYGVAGVYCPSGITLSDGLCDIEFMLEVNLKCTVGVEDESWGGIKSLYR